MSYILEALNKSEQEKRSKQAPDLSTIHRGATEIKRSKAWVPVIIALVVINLAALGFWLSGSKDEGPVTGLPEAKSEMDQNPTSDPVAITQPPSKPVAPPSRPDQPAPLSAPTSTDILITQGNSGVAPDPVRITELPVNVQRQIPDLVFSSHLYSDDASFRMVNINGRMIREGDTVANGLSLFEITEAGVVLRFRHYYFEVSVLQDWRFD